MTGFLVLAAVLALLTLYAVLRPLLARSRALAAASAALILLGSGLLYWQLGTPVALDPAMLRAPQNMEEVRAQLQARLRMTPDSAEDWRLLGRSYSAENRLPEAAEAHARAARLTPQDPDALTEAAHSRARARGNQFDATAIAWLQQALAIAPEHQTARWYLGISQRQQGRAAEAVATWMPLLDQVQDESARASLFEQINLARADAGLEALPAMPAPKPAGIRVEILPDPALPARLASRPDARLFVLARAAGGPPMPLAVERHPVPTAPLQLTLDDSDSPMPTLKLSSQSEVEVLARISISGSADKSPDDIETAPVKVRLPAAEPIKIRLQAPAKD